MGKGKDKIKVHDQSVNYYGCVVLTSGIDLSYFQRNPVMLHNHNSDCAIGTIGGLEVSGTDILIDEPVFHVSDPEVARLKSKYDAGVIRGFSINVEMQEVQLGVAGFPADVPVVTKSILNEISLTPLPGNRNAIKMSYQGKELTPESLQLTLNQLNPNSKMKTLLLSIVAAFNAAKLNIKLDQNSTEDEVGNAIRTLAETHSTVVQERDQLKLKLQELQTAAINDLVDGAVKEGKILEADRGTYITLAQGNLDAAKKAIAGMKPHQPFNGKLNQTGEEGQETDERKSWNFDDYHKKDPKALQLMKTSDPDRYRKLFNAKYKSASS